VGQLAEVPLQTSAVSQTVEAARHENAVVRTVSTGQLFDVPSQTSATSHTPAEPRHSAVVFASFGHVVDVPVQVSATSQTPAPARQTVAVVAGTSAGQVALVPLQFSAASQVAVEPRQTVLVGANASTGHVVAVPLQVSAASHTPFAARHVVPALPATLVQAPVAVTHVSTVQGFVSAHSALVAQPQTIVAPWLQTEPIEPPAVLPADVLSSVTRYAPCVLQVMFTRAIVPSGHGTKSASCCSMKRPVPVLIEQLEVVPAVAGPLEHGLENVNAPTLFGLIVEATAATDVNWLSRSIDSWHVWPTGHVRAWSET
jgi:hypothetical protein